MTSPAFIIKIIYNSPFRLICAMVYYGLNLNTRSLDGDPYFIYFIAAIVEIPPMIICIIFLDKVGRRIVFLSCILLAGIACEITAFLPKGNVFIRETSSIHYTLLIVNQNVVHTFNKES